MGGFTVGGPGRLCVEGGMSLEATGSALGTDSSPCLSFGFLSHESRVRTPVSEGRWGV